MKKTLKRTFGMMLAIVMTISSLCCVTAFANEEEVLGWPEGTIKVQEGIYAVPEEKLPATRNWTDDVTVNVPAQPNIVQPSSLKNIRIETTNEWLCIKSDEPVYINFVRNSQSVFGDNYWNWLFASNPRMVYFVETDYYNMTRNVSYATQLTSKSGCQATVSIRSSDYKLQY